MTEDCCSNGNESWKQRMWAFTFIYIRYQFWSIFHSKAIVAAPEFDDFPSIEVG